MLKSGREVHTSSPISISRRAMIFMTGSFPFVLPLRGNTKTAFGRHEWFVSATSGDTVAPMGVSEGEVSANVFVMN